MIFQYAWYYLWTEIKMRQRFLAGQIFLRFSVCVCGTSDLKTHHCRLSALMNIFIQAQTFALLPSLSLALYHICTRGGGLSCQWTAWWDSSPPNKSTSPQALGGTHLHGNCNRVAVTEGRPLQPVRKETDRQKEKHRKIFFSAEKNSFLCNSRGRNAVKTLQYKRSHVVCVVEDKADP